MFGNAAKSNHAAIIQSAQASRLRRGKSWFHVQSVCGTTVGGEKKRGELLGRCLPSQGAILRHVDQLYRPGERYNSKVKDHGDFETLRRSVELGWR